MKINNFFALFLGLWLMACQAPDAGTMTPVVSGNTQRLVISSGTPSGTITPATPTRIPSGTATPVPPTSLPMPSPTPSPTLTRVPVRAPSVESTAAPATAPATDFDDSLRLGLVGNPPALNPLTHLDPILARLSPLLYASLNRREPFTGRAQPALAELPLVAADGLTLTYTLRYSRPTAADVKAGLEAAIWPELDSLRRVTVLSSNTVRVELLEPDCVMIDYLADLPVLPADMVTADNPASTGPYQRAPLQTEANRLVLTPSSIWPESVSGPAEIILNFYHHQAKAWAALEAGQLDVLPLKTPPANIPSGYRLVDYPSSTITFVTFNHTEPPLDKPAARQALGLAVDRAAILDQAFEGYGQVAGGFWPAAHWAALPDRTPPVFDPAQAARQLDQAGVVDTDDDGWRNLPDSGELWRLPLRVDEDSPAEVATALLVAAAYREINIQAYVEIVPFETLIDDLLTHDYAAAVYSLAISPVLDWEAYWSSDQTEAEFGINLSAYANSQVDSRLKQARTGPGCDPTRQAELYQKVEAQLIKDRPVDFLIQQAGFLIVKESIAENLSPGPFAPFTWEFLLPDRLSPPESMP